MTGVGDDREGRLSLRRRKGTLTPLVPLSCRAIKGEGERRTEAEVGARAPTSASSSILGRGEGRTA